MRYAACSGAQKYELKPTHKIKSQFFFVFQAIIRSIAQKITNPYTLYEARPATNSSGGSHSVLSAIHTLYTEIPGDGHGLGLYAAGRISHGKARRIRHIRPSLSLTIDRILHGEESIRLSQYKEGEFAILENELEKMTIRLREQNESLKGEKIYLAEMLADISHQIRTPLTALNLLVTRMGREAIRKETQEEGRLLLLQEMKRLLERVEWLVTTLLKLSRLDAGCVSFQKERFSVRELLMNAAEPFFVPMELRGQELEVQAAETIFSEGDAVWLTEAVGNLIKNSMEHTHQGGRITLLAEENPIYVQIKVLDNGEGIAEEALPHLFERFYKGENASSGSFGIGLSFAEKIVTKQGGVIHAENIPDGGACFTVRFYKTAV